jgi:hypothetical protein
MRKTALQEWVELVATGNEVSEDETSYEMEMNEEDKFKIRFD